MKRSIRQKQEAWAQACDRYFGRSIHESEVCVGLRFCMYSGDFHLDREWLEIMDEPEWDWRYQEPFWPVYNETLDCIDYYDTESILKLGKIVEEDK